MTSIPRVQYCNLLSIIQTAMSKEFNSLEEIKNMQSIYDTAFIGLIRLGYIHEQKLNKEGSEVISLIIKEDEYNCEVDSLKLILKGEYDYLISPINKEMKDKDVSHLISYEDDENDKKSGLNVFNKFKGKPKEKVQEVKTKRPTESVNTTPIMSTTKIQSPITPVQTNFQSVPQPQPTIQPMIQPTPQPQINAHVQQILTDEEINKRIQEQVARQVEVQVQSRMKSTSDAPILERNTSFIRDKKKEKKLEKNRIFKL